MKPARTVLWGNLPIKRSAIPELLADLSTWPTVDTSEFSEIDRTVYDSRAEAVRLFVEEKEVSIVGITRKTGVHREQLYRLLNRCLGKAEDGRIQGFRGVIPGKHLKDYARTAPVKPSKPKSKGGAAGAFTALLERCEKIRTWLVRQAKLRKKPLGSTIRKVRKTIPDLHREFLNKLREAGVCQNEYPFNRDLQGLRSFQAFVRLVENGGNELNNGDDAEPPDVSGSSQDAEMASSQVPQHVLPFDGVQFDGHKIDLRLTLRYVDPFGLEFLFEITRIWILVALDVASRAVLGFQLVLAPEYDSDEIARALQSCFGASHPPQFTIPGLSVREGGGFPCDIFEAAKYPRWRWFQYDSARANLAEPTLVRLTEIVGCYIHTGRLGEPDDRAIIERFFAYLAKCGLHQTPGTTGSRPDDEVKHLADVGNDLSRLMTIDELSQVVYVMLADKNGESHAGLGGRTPNEALRYWLNKPGVEIWQLPTQKRRKLLFLQEARIVTVVGGSKTQRRPHINFEGVRYTSDLLAGKPELIGKKLRIYFNIQDIRQLHAFFEDGAELGVLIASRSWRKTAHSLRLRKEILRLIRLGKLRYRDGDDAIEAWAIYKRKNAAKVKRAATALAHQQQVEEFAASVAADVAIDQPTANGMSASAPERESAPDRSITAAESDEKSDTPSNGNSPPTPRVLRVRRTIVFGGNR